MMNPARLSSLQEVFNEEEIENVKTYCTSFLKSQFLFDTIQLFVTAKFSNCPKTWERSRTFVFRINVFQWDILS
eukprot:UN05119